VAPLEANPSAMSGPVSTTAALKSRRKMKNQKINKILLLLLIPRYKVSDNEFYNINLSLLVLSAIHLFSK
jgi:hypothetical protein